MTKPVGLLLVLCIATGLAFAQGTEAKKPAATGSSAAEELKQAERDWIDGQKAGNADKIGQVLADDWKGLTAEGKRVNKQEYLADYKSGVNKYESIEIGPMDAHVFGNIGVVQGSDTEKSTYKGKDTSGKYV